jgi:hypothetical protein
MRRHSRTYRQERRSRNFRRIAATMDLKFTCTRCGQRSGLNIEVEPVAAQAFLYNPGPGAETDEAGPGSHLLCPHPWEDHSYPKDDGVRAWNTPDVAAEKGALEVQEVS